MPFAAGGGMHSRALFFVNFLALIAVSPGCVPLAPLESDSGVVDSGIADAGISDTKPVADPVSWRPVGALLHGRVHHTATLLNDGRVLIVGGEDAAQGMLASCAFFDPVHGNFVAGPPLPQGRSHHTATLLRDGKVLVAGGGVGSSISIPNGTGALDSALLFDPLTDTWQPTGAMNAARAGHQAVLLDDGRVLVAGGGNTIGYNCAASHPECTVAASLASTEVFENGQWTAAGDMKQPRIAFTLNMLPSGRVLAAGGAANNQSLSNAERFDPHTSTWTATAAMGQARLFHAAGIANGVLVVVGGKVANVAPIKDSERFDEATGQWQTIKKLNTPRTGAAMVTLQSGRVLLVGGNNQLGIAHLAEAATYDATADQWGLTNPLSQGRYGHTATRLKDGSVLVVGGLGDTGVLSSAERSQ